MQHTRSAEVRYIAFGGESESWNLRVNTVGFESIADHANYPANGHPTGYNFSFERGRKLHEYQVLYLTRGQGRFQSKHSLPCEVTEGSVIFLFPGEWHTYRPLESTGWETYWVGFDGNPARELLEANRVSLDNPIMKLGYDEEMVGLYKKLLDVSLSERPGYRQLLSGMTIHLLTYLFYRGKQQSWHDKEALNQIEKARLIMRESFRSSVSPEDIAAQLNMSYSWFRRIFRQYTGLAPARYLNRLKMQSARELLSDPNKTVKEVALELGYESTDYFSVAFKRYNQLTPCEFRRKAGRN
jgi:AraC-like DNA-binding protein